MAFVNAMVFCNKFSSTYIILHYSSTGVGCKNLFAMAEVYNNNNAQHHDLTYPKKVWIAAGILSLVVVLLLLFKTLFSLLLLVFAGILIAVLFHGFAGLLRRYLHLPHTVSVVVSVLFNMLLLVAFFWFVGNRL